MANQPVEMPAATGLALGARTDAPQRLSPLAGRHAGNAQVTITPASAASRLSLRAPATSRAALSRALGLTLPERPKQSATTGARTALWLGPDEWLVIDQDGSDLPGVLQSVTALHSAVDVSHRNTAAVLTGPAAEAVLSSGCPQDLRLATFPVGACSRTILGKAEVVIWRTAPETFRVEVWRSFSDYVFTLLSVAARELV